MHQALAVSLSRALMALDDGEAAVLPSGPRTALEARRRHLRDALAPCGSQQAAVIFAKLANMAAKSEHDRKTAAALVAQDVADLSDMPAFALEAAVSAYRRAEIGSGEWRPTAGMIRAEAIKRVEAHAKELGKIARVLDAPLRLAAPKPATAEQRAKIAAGLSDLARKMGG